MEIKDQYYFKPNIIIGPLVDKWYAWTHLISPATAAMNIVERHLKIMNSYIQAPMIHEAAVKNPKMLGGPFMDYETRRVEEVKELKADILDKQANAIALSDAIKELDRMLKTKAKGASLEPLYKEVPEILKGYVELVYDLNNNVSFRFFESLLYSSPFYSKQSQSISLWETLNDERPFCLSTPQLEDPKVLQLDIPFDHKGIDTLSRMKRNPGSIEDVAEKLGVREDQMELFKTFFTKKEHPTYKKYTGDKARMRYLGHACILIETKDVSILVDPLISYYGYESTVEHFSDIDLPDVIDYVLITHNHQDHIVLETLLPLRHKIKNIIVPVTTSGALQDPSIKLAFQSIGFKNVIEIDELEEIKFENCTITGLPFTGEHSDLNIRAKSCYHVAINELSFLFVADSRVMEPRLYEHIQRVKGDVDVLFLGMECAGAPLSWLYGCLMTENINREDDQSRRLAGCDSDRGLSLVDIFNPKEAYVYAMGMEPWLEFISSIKYTEESLAIIESNRLINSCKENGIIAERLFGEKELLYDYELKSELVDN
ncbi:MBL fold metallo-hydrolase [Flavobacterium sp. Fl-77]|uniref:MBL fold metallo-hydrolase n=1 Tax=Flavobacterium flavipigmentatum TaxID=2893884 RepID=A0AAJ2VZ12_9FLAO|nr:MULTISPECIES: MBL fold metallo-hydrolase [unclassified Flavobacterium]MDX6183152.1 MBL fold metallo-hydrolase [Flavobacterium sp. Fl-33]MDX6186779.1 MBL fold metallo-hydrolase [Flavobacterium sp. Fl-77]UFH40433.1 MBL fold metallo-hydrolase [Flavobacterium sp. F-70]